LSSPEQLGKYRIEAILGEGGMGIVYQAYDPHLARPVAIKTIRRSLLQGQVGRELRARFQREARAEGRLAHPNIVAIYEYHEGDEGDPFFVMEFVEGKSLKEFLARGMHFNLEMAVHIISQVLSALSHSHEQGIIHRDIKPANIILMENDKIKIADFGIARIEDSDYTQTGMVIGTPKYFSPEQGRGEKIDARSDLYSTGLVLYELLTGEQFFSHGTATATAMNHRNSDDKFAKLDTQSAKVLHALKLVLTRALATEAKKRFQSADEFLNALQPLKTPDVTPAQKGQGRRWLAVAGFAPLLLVGGYFVWQSAVPNGWLEGVMPHERKVLTTQEQKKVADLLGVGRAHLIVGRLLTPEGSSAYDAYTLVLEIDPGNADAKKGMNTLSDKLMSKIDRLQKMGDAENARKLATLAQQRIPGSSFAQDVLP